MELEAMGDKAPWNEVLWSSYPILMFESDLFESDFYYLDLVGVKTVSDLASITDEQIKTVVEERLRFQVIDGFERKLEVEKGCRELQKFRQAAIDYVIRVKK